MMPRPRRGIPAVREQTTNMQERFSGRYVRNGPEDAKEVKH